MTRKYPRKITLALVFELILTLRKLVWTHRALNEWNQTENQTMRNLMMMKILLEFLLLLLDDLKEPQRRLLGTASRQWRRPCPTTELVDH